MYSSSVRGSEYKIELKAVELTSSIIVNKVTLGFFKLMLFLFTVSMNFSYKVSSLLSISGSFEIALLNKPNDKFFDISLSSILFLFSSSNI